MSELVSFEDAAKELGATTEEVSRLVRMGKLKTAERGGLLMVSHDSLLAQKAATESAPLELAEEPKPTDGVSTIRLAPEAEIEEVGAEEEKKPAAAPAAQPPGEKTESIFGDVELETFAEVPAEGQAAGEEVGQLEEAGEELGAEEVAQLAQAGGPGVRRAVAARPQTSTAVTVLLVLTFILLVFAGVVIFNFGLRKSQLIFDPIQSGLQNLAK
jgi:hypothetical protein